MKPEKKNNPFLLNANEIRQQGHLSLTLNPAAAVLDDAFPNRDVLQKISVQLEFTVAEEDIVLAAKVNADLKLECSRCSKEIVRSYSDSFDEYYPYSVEYIDLRENIRETVSLMEPMRVLCEESCKGRCPVCGADLNVSKCSCVVCKPSAFEGLKNFKPEKI